MHSICFDRPGSCYLLVITVTDPCSMNLQLSCFQSHSDTLYDMGLCCNHGLSSHLLDWEPSNVQSHPDPLFVWGLMGTIMTMAPFPLVRNLAVPRPVLNLY